MSDLDHARMMLNMAGKDLKALQNMLDMSAFAMDISSTLKFLYALLRLVAHPHRKAGATSVIKRSSCSRFHGGRKVGM
jgi:hypothetical protein